MKIHDLISSRILDISVYCSVHLGILFRVNLNVFLNILFERCILVLIAGNVSDLTIFISFKEYVHTSL